jgi:hypothetical protein
MMRNMRRIGRRNRRRNRRSNMRRNRRTNIGGGIGEGIITMTFSDVIKHGRSYLMVTYRQITWLSSKYSKYFSFFFPLSLFSYY